MSITRWDPWGDIVTLREAMNNLLEQSYVQPRARGEGGASTLALDLRETPDSFVVTAAIPGVRPEDVDINILGDTLQISGRHREEREEKGEEGRWLLRERRTGSFERMVRLPCAVKPGSAEAEFKDGILTVTLPKAEEAKPRSIPVRAGGQAQAIDVASGARRQA
jgi:HSP20 family protein